MSSSSGSDAGDREAPGLDNEGDSTPSIAGTCLHGWSKCEFCGFDSEGKGPAPACSSCGERRPLQNGRCEPCRTRGFQTEAFSF